MWTTAGVCEQSVSTGGDTCGLKIHCMSHLVELDESGESLGVSQWMLVHIMRQICRWSHVDPSPVLQEWEFPVLEAVGWGSLARIFWWVSSVWCCGIDEKDFRISRKVLREVEPGERLGGYICVILATRNHGDCSLCCWLHIHCWPWLEWVSGWWHSEGEVHLKWDKVVRKALQPQKMSQRCPGVNIVKDHNSQKQHSGT